MAQKITGNQIDGVWESWTPTLTNLSGGTLNYAKYKQTGKNVHCRFKYTLASAGISGEIDVTYPITANADLVDSIIGPLNSTSILRDTSPGTSYVGIVLQNDTSKFRLRFINSSGTIQSITASTPFTWASTDVIYAAFTYEAA